MNSLALPGVHFRRNCFVPNFSKYQGEQCFGVQLHITDKALFDAFEAGLLLMETIRNMHEDRFAFISWTPGAMPAIDRLLGTDSFRTERMSARELIKVHAPHVKAFQEASGSHYLY